MKRFFILNADDLGMSKTKNKAIFDAYDRGFLKSASLCVNGDEFEDAVKNVISRCPDLGIGIHLNIIEGRALIPISSLTDSYGNFRLNFFQLLLRSINRNFLKDVENEFRAQIEKGLVYIKFDHVDSHVHTHGIPRIFKIAAALAKEYGIKGIRTQFEKRYMAPGRKNINLAFFINRIKIILLNTFTRKNIKILDSFYKTNDFLIGVGYTAMMDSLTVEYGLRKLANVKTGSRAIAEALFHPDSKCQNGEYNIPFDQELKEKINAMGYEITNYSEILHSNAVN
jgi:predicted glycoside hydrolase/deacetylase ChbG (UPF0249 family)